MPWARDASRRALDAVPRSASARSLGDVRSRHPRRLTRVAASLLAVALALGMTVAGSAVDAGAAPRETDAVSPEDMIEDSECPVAIPREHADRVTCSVLTVPERRTAGSDPLKTVRLPVAVIASRNSDPAGGSARLPDLGRSGREQFRVAVVLPRPRRLGGRRPGHHRRRAAGRHAGGALAELSRARHRELHRGRSGPAAAPPRPSAGRQQLEACHDRLIEEGIDLGAYTSAESAADLSDLRAALDYDEWNLYGDLVRLAPCHDGDARSPRRTPVGHPRWPLPAERRRVRIAPDGLHDGTRHPVRPVRRRSPSATRATPISSRGSGDCSTAPPRRRCRWW